MAVGEFFGEYDHEPVRGLPGRLPPGETLLWQGVPSWWRFAVQVLHVRAIVVYFALIAGWRLAVGLSDGLAPMAIVTGIAGIALLGALVLAVMVGYAVLMARSTVYSVTDRRVLIRYGIAMPKTWNIPFRLIRSASYRPCGSGGHGDICLELEPGNRIAYLLLWPNAKPWALKQPQPMFRGVGDAEQAAQVLGRALEASTRRRAAAAARPLPPAATTTPAAAGATTANTLEGVTG